MGGEVGEVALQYAADEQLGEPLGIDRLGEAAQRLDERRADGVRVEDAIEHPIASIEIGDGFGKEHLEVVHRHVVVAQRRREGVVLLPGALGPQHIVEEQFFDVRGRQAAQLQPRLVEDHLTQPSNFGIDVERHGRITFRHSSGGTRRECRERRPSPRSCAEGEAPASPGGGESPGLG